MGRLRRRGRISSLSEDELCLILNWLSDSNDRKSFSLVCKQWMRLEGRTRISIRLLQPKFLHQLLPRFPNLVKFETFKPLRNSDLRFLGHACPKIEVINLNLLEQSWDLGDFGRKGLYYLGNGCPNLSSLSLRGRHGVTSDGVGWLVKKARKLRYLDLKGCIFVTDGVLEAIGSWSSISYLNLESCCKITDRGLGFLANGACSKTLKTLVLSWCNGITDFGISILQKMSCLEDLSLGYSGTYGDEKFTDIGGIAISKIQTLKKLNIPWSGVTDQTIAAIAENCLNLQVLDLSCCRLVTIDGLRAFRGHMCLKSLVWRFCNGFSQSDLEQIALGCPALEFIEFSSDRRRLKRALPSS